MYAVSSESGPPGVQLATYADEPVEVQSPVDK